MSAPARIATPPAHEEPPAFVVSLDFELRWGVHDRLGLDRERYRRNLEDVREVVPLLLGALRERGLRATWATVGAVACGGWSEYFDRAPKPPRFRDPALAVDPRYAGIDPDGALHFAPDLVRRILDTPGQELGTHTFSHLPLREPGVTAADAEADLSAAVRLWKDRFGTGPRSLVFPRNQSRFLEIARRFGIRVWRGNPKAWFHESTEAATNRPAARALRLLDDLSPWARRAVPLEGDMTRATVFLRLDLPSPAWHLHRARLRRELDGLRPGEIFHLWWHPHNVGGDVAVKMGRVREALDLAAERVARGALRTAHMGDLVP